MLIRNDYHLNATLQDYEINNMTLEKKFEIKKHLATYKTLYLQFIILPRYVIPKLTTTTTFIPLKDAGNNNLPNRFFEQSRSYIKSQLVYNII